jgi:hypothetical protein
MLKPDAFQPLASRIRNEASLTRVSFTGWRHSLRLILVGQ